MMSEASLLVPSGPAKKLFLSAVLAFGTATVFGQGQVGFANNAAQTITNLFTYQPAAGSSAQDDTQVGLYIGNVGDPVSTLTLIGRVTNCFAPGRFNGGNRTLQALFRPSYLGSTPPFPKQDGVFACEPCLLLVV